ncbi:MAG: MafI family immunity protein [Myxococcota bacterium]|nr:MafI family immunity protein [Myxococcota bacterium]
MTEWGFLVGRRFYVLGVTFLRRWLLRGVVAARKGMLRVTSDEYEAELTRLIERCHEAGLSAHDRDQMLDLTTHNEGTIALEHLCTQLHEYDIALSHETREAIRKVSKAYRVGDDYTSLLDELPIAP